MVSSQQKQGSARQEVSDDLVARLTWDVAHKSHIGTQSKARIRNHEPQHEIATGKPPDLLVSQLKAMGAMEGLGCPSGKGSEVSLPSCNLPSFGLHLKVTLVT